MDAFRGGFEMLDANRTYLKRLSRLLLTVGLLALLLCLQSFVFGATAFADTEEITVRRVDFRVEYPVAERPTNIAWESLGRAWFTSPDQDVIGVVTRNTNADNDLVSVSIYYIALEFGSRPFDIAYANDTVWYTEFNTGILGRIDVGGPGPFTEPTKRYTLPTPGTRPAGVAVAPDGSVWVASANRAKLTRFDPISETFEVHDYSALLQTGGTISTNTTFPDVAIGSDLIIWFTVPGSDFVLGYQTDKDRFARLFLSGPNRRITEPGGIALDSTNDGKIPGGYPWVTAYGSNLVGRYAPETLAGWDWYEIPTASSGPRGIAFQNNGAIWDIWFTEEKAGQVGRLTVTPKLEFVSFVEIAQKDGSKPWSIVVGDDSTVWYTESGRRTLVEMWPPYISFLRLPLVLVSE